MKRMMAVLALAGLGLAGCDMARGMMRERSDLVATPDSCSSKRFDIYFADGEARLTDAAREAIGLTATQLQGCEIRKVQVVGLADASGGSAANLSLSERRARTVAEALTATGWPAPAFDVGAAGDAGAEANGVNEPLRRRTEVVVTAAPK